MPTDDIANEALDGDTKQPKGRAHMSAYGGERVRIHSTYPAPHEAAARPWLLRLVTRR